MKIKTSMQNIKSRFRKVYRCGYCDLQYIMRGYEPQYYNCGTYGWNCDIYADYKNDIAITTGYRNMAGKRIPDEIIVEYTQKAKAIIEERNWKEENEKLYLNREAFFEAINNL